MTLKTRLSKLEARRPTPAEELYIKLSWDDPRLAGEVAPERRPGDRVIKLSWGDERDDETEGES